MLPAAEPFDAVPAVLPKGPAPRRRTAAFPVDILNKRLSSHPTAFAQSWSPPRQGLSRAETASENDVPPAKRPRRQHIRSDRKIQQRAATAAPVAGAWLRHFADPPDARIPDIEDPLGALNLDLQRAPIAEQTLAPPLDRLITPIEHLLVEAMAPEIDLDCAPLPDTLQAPLAILADRPRFQRNAEPAFCRVLYSHLAGSRDAIDQTAHRPVPSRKRPPMPRLVFTTEPFIERLGPLTLFSPPQNSLLVHLPP